MMIIAERGGMDLGPENTLYAIEQSLEAGATAVHIDIRTTMDDMPVLMHNATVDRTTSGEGAIYRMNLNVATHLETTAGVRVPSLQQVLEALQKHKCNIFIELKHPATAGPTATVVNNFQRKKGYMQGRIVVTSLYHQLVTLIHDKYPSIATAAIVDKIPESLAAFGEYTKSSYIIAPIDLLDKAFVDDAHKRKIRFIASGCNAPTKVEQAQKFKAHGIITPNPKFAA